MRALEGSWAAAARILYLVAMAVFVVTIAIGILNGLDLVEFDRNQLLTHVHSGTVGWLTLSLVATAMVYFRRGDLRLAAALGLMVPLYVAAFYTGSFALRAISGTILLAIVAWVVVWVWQSYLASERSLVGLGLTLALSTFGYGAVVGVLLQVGFATGTTIVPGDGIGAHAGAMTFGYLVLAAMAIIEWQVRDTAGLPRGGLLQLGALFVGGLILSIALLTGAAQLGGTLYLLAELIAVTLFVVRIVPAAVRVDWAGPDPLRHVAAASLWVVAALLLFMYLVSQFIAAPDDPDLINRLGGVLIASDHAVYIGVISNLVFAVLARRVAPPATSDLSRQLMFWGLNAGLLLFAAGLVSDSVILKQIGAPLMGLFLLHNLAVYARTLARASGSAAEAVAPA